MNTPPIDAPKDAMPVSPDDQTVSIGGQGSPLKDDDFDFFTPSTRPDSLARLGHYEVLEILGKGGFGIVLRAFDDTLQRVVAIKVLMRHLAATSPARKRFLREARASAKVRHENVVQVYAIEETPIPYIVMEYVPGETLQQRMDAIGPLRTDETVRIGIQIARGLAAAHETGLVHRDVKPGNVILETGPEGRVKLTDFGLARAADDASLTQSGAVTGTPQYMAPEQARGDRLDHRADLFSLGSVLYAMVSGRPQFRAENQMAVLKRVCEDSPRSIQEIMPEVPDWLCSIIAKLHAKDPAQRFQSAREVVEVLTKCQTGAPPNIALNAARASGRKRAVAASLVLAALLAAAGIYYWSTRGGAPVQSASSLDKPTNEAVSVPPAPPPPDMALMFDGKEHMAYAETLVRDEDIPVTLEGWFKMFGPTPTYRTVLALGGDAAVWIANSPDTIAPLSFRLPAPQNAFRDLGGKIRFGDWMHVALVYDQKETRFFLDGKFLSRTPQVDPPVKPQRWPVGGLIIGSGRYTTGGNITFPGQFVGQLDEIRVSKTARYDGDFTPQRRFDSDPDTLALYHCDEVGQNVLTDASGNGHHATITGATWVEVAP